MAISVSSILSRVATLLQDATNIRWTQAELIDWLNDGQREIAVKKPNAFVKNVSVALVGGTKQSLPADAIALVDVVRNMGTNGTTPGPAVRMVSREILDAQVPDWHASAASATAKHFVHTILDPRTFYVYPPQPSVSPGQVEIVYAAYPPDATSGGNVQVQDLFQPALINYILFRAYSKDVEYAANKELAAAYYALFEKLLDSKNAAEAASNPERALGAASPNVPGSHK